MGVCDESSAYLNPIARYDRGMPPHRGQLIIALPDLVDPNFHQTATVLVEHNESGTLGLTLNRPAATTMKEAWEQLDGVTSPCHHTGLLHIGGPCPGPLMVLHTRPERAQIVVHDGLCFSSEPEDIAWLLEHNDEPMKCFANYSSWGPGQLETEIERESWIIREATAAHVFGTSPRLWYDLLRQINPSQAAIVNNPSLLDSDPSLN